MFLSIIALITQLTAIGFSTSILKILINNATPLLAFGLRNAAAGAFFIVSSTLFSRKKSNVLMEIPRYTLLGAFFRVFFPSVIAYWALQYVSPAKFAFLYNLCPFVTYILSYLILSEPMTRRKLIGITIGFIGSIPILMTRTTLEDASVAQFFSVSLPEFGLLVAVVSLCMGSVLLKHVVVKHSEYSIFAISGYDSFIGGSLALLLAYFLPFHQEVYNPYEFVKWALIMTISTGLVVRPLYAWLLKTFSATLLSIGSLAVPFTTAFFTWLHFGEVIGVEYYYSTALVLIGCVIFYSEEKRLTVINSKQVLN